MKLNINDNYMDEQFQSSPDKSFESVEDEQSPETKTFYVLKKPEMKYLGKKIIS